MKFYEMRDIFLKSAGTFWKLDGHFSKIGSFCFFELWRIVHYISISGWQLSKFEAFLIYK